MTRPKNKNPSTLYSFQLNIFTYFNREVKSKWQERLFLCLHITATARFHYYYYSFYFFFLILNHAIFIIPFANHRRSLCKHEKGVERNVEEEKKYKCWKIIIITRPTIVVHMLKASFAFHQSSTLSILIPLFLLQYRPESNTQKNSYFPSF